MLATFTQDTGDEEAVLIGSQVQALLCTKFIKYFDSCGVYTVQSFFFSFLFLFFFWVLFFLFCFYIFGIHPKMFITNVMLNVNLMYNSHFFVKTQTDPHTRSHTKFMDFIGCNTQCFVAVNASHAGLWIVMKISY